MKSMLLSPVTIGKNTFKNRVIMSPMCMYSSENQDGILDKKRFDHYTTRAFGGVGGIVVEATAVCPNAGISLYDLGLYNDEQEAALAKLVESVHYYDCKIGIQLGHAGRKGQGYSPIYSSSATAPFNDGYIAPTEADAAYIQHVVDSFGQAAKRAERAGFDFIELHCAHGYFLSQFLSPLVNARTDEFGGSLENRYRIVKQVIASVKANSNLDIHLRISANEVEAGGNSIDDIIQILTWAKADGVIFFDISSAGITPQPPQPIFAGHQALISRKITAAGLDCGAVGLLDDPSICEYILRGGDAKVIYLGRPLLSHPFWVKEAAVKLHDEFSFPLAASYERAY